jgi:signal transduction histidine kinase
VRASGRVVGTLAPTLLVILALSLALGLLAIPSFVGALRTEPHLTPHLWDRLLSVAMAPLSAVAFGLAWRGHVHRATWLYLGGLALVWLVLMPVTGLSAQTSALAFIMLPLLLAGTILGRPALWTFFGLTLLALLLGAFADGATLATLLRRPEAGGLYFVNLALIQFVFAILVDGLGVRLRRALDNEANRSEDLARANEALVSEQEQVSELERALGNAQRLESMGRLSGSVAHDFNNLITGIAGNAALAARISEDPKVRELMETIDQLGERASDLTKDLLQFSRGDDPTAEQVDVHELILRGERIYGALVGESILVRFDLAATESIIQCNPGRFQQVVLNLIVNAADAMSEGGELTIGTRDDEAGGRPPHLRLFVRDTGEGMSDTVRANIFQPFFTTKGTQGTGVGLATVQEVVTDLGGRVEVDSKVGGGTTFRIDLPLVA